MKEFFKNQLETLYTRTGFRQLENMMQSPNWEKEIAELIKFMIEECDKPPFNCVKETVKARVIARAVVEDQEFTGLNAKFVRKALNAWWKDNGDRVLDAMNSQSAGVNPAPLTPEQNAKVNVLLESYRKSLITPMPKMKPDEIAKEGAEWKSELERKAVSVGFKPPSAQAIKARELHMQWIAENFDTRTGAKLPSWLPEEEWLKQRNP